MATETPDRSSEVYGTSQVLHVHKYIATLHSLVSRCWTVYRLPRYLIHWQWGANTWPEHGHLGEYDSTREDWLAYIERLQQYFTAMTWETWTSSEYSSAQLVHPLTSSWIVYWHWIRPQRRHLMSWSNQCKTTINLHHRRVCRDIWTFKESWYSQSYGN